MRRRRYPGVDMETANGLGLGPRRHALPEVDLLLAVLDRAIRDALGIRSALPRGVEQSARRQAIRWLGLEDPYREDPDPAPWSCQWVCDHLGVDARYIHSQLARAVVGSAADEDLAAVLRSHVLYRGFTRYDDRVYHIDRSRV